MLERTPIEPDERVAIDYCDPQSGRDRQPEYAIDRIRDRTLTVHP